MAQNAVPPTRLIPRFPNEISDLILLQRPFHDLLNVYFVSNTLRGHVDDNDEMCRRMFRLPQALEAADSTARHRFVADLWANTNSKVPYDELATKLWPYIRINPLIDLDSGSLKWYGGYKMPTPAAPNNSALPQMPTYLRPWLQRFWRSMFTTYPPVSRIEYFYTIPASLWFSKARDEMIVRPEGVTIGQLVLRTVESGRGIHHLYVELWPEKAWMDIQLA
jgi:hypothetical protein